MGRHPIITIIGSTRFKKDMVNWAWNETKKGYLVLLPTFTKEDNKEVEKNRELVESIHFQKIKMADMIFVFNKDKYTGNSTNRELNYAKSLNKLIKYFE